MKVHRDGPFFTFLTQTCFPLGIIILMPDAESSLSAETIGSRLFLHASGYWGKVGEDEVRANDEALKHGGPVMSLFASEPLKTPFRIITDGDRRHTYVMLEYEYPELEAGRIVTFGKQD